MFGVPSRTRVTHGASTSRPPPHVCNPAGTARAPFYTGEPTFSVHPRRAGVEARPYGASASHQRCINPSVTAQSAVTAPLSGEPRWRGAAHRRRPTVRRSLQKGPVRGPVLFALKCPRAFQPFFHGQIAQQRAGKPTPSRSLGKEQMIIAPVGGHWSRLRMTSIWKRSTSRMYCSPG